jgi:hypothetical protein
MVGAIAPSINERKSRCRSMEFADAAGGEE